MSDQLTKRLDTLRKSQLRLAEQHVAELESLKEEADMVAADCRRLLGPARRSLRALEALGKAPNEPTSLCTNAAEVRELMQLAIEARGPMTPEDLETAVGQAIRRRGKTLKMFGRLFKQCLRDDRFGRTGDHVTLARDQPAQPGA